MFTRVFVCLCAGIVVLAQPPASTFPVYDAASPGYGPVVTQHDFPRPGGPQGDRWDNIATAETGGYTMTQQPDPRPVSADQLRHPLTGKALTMIRKAERLIAAKKFEFAREELKKATKNSAAAPYALSLLGQEYVRAMQFSEAVDPLEKAVQLLPSSVADHGNLGYSLLMIGRTGDSETELRKALELEPNNPRTHLVMGILCYTAGDRDEEAEEHLSLAAKEIPSAQVMLARFRELMGRKTSGARTLR